MEDIDQRRKRLAAYVAKWRRLNPEKQKLARSRTYINRKRRAFEALGGAICAHCGCDEMSFLEINHINGGGCVEWRQRRASIHDYILSGKRSVEGLNVLCRVCNAMEFLKNKKANATGNYKIVWCKYTGQTKIKINGKETDWSSGSRGETDEKENAKGKTISKRSVGKSKRQSEATG